MKTRDTHAARHLSRLLVLISLIGFAPAALAAPIIYEVTGRAVERGPRFSESIFNLRYLVDVGTPFTGRFLYDPETAVDRPPRNAEWNPASTGMSISIDIGGIQAQTVSTARGWGAFGIASWGESLFSLEGPAADEIGYITSLQVYLLSADPGVLGPDPQLPTTLDLADWDEPYVFVGGPIGGIFAEIETMVLVPEPSTALLLGLGLGALGVRGRRAIVPHLAPGRNS